MPKVYSLIKNRIRRDYTEEEFQKMIEKGGPGSGRYPAGSGKGDEPKGEGVKKEPKEEKKPLVEGGTVAWEGSTIIPIKLSEQKDHDLISGSGDKTEVWVRKEEDGRYSAQIGGGRTYSVMDMIKGRADDIKSATPEAAVMKVQIIAQEFADFLKKHKVE
jgi:hypothetical protein